MAENPVYGDATLSLIRQLAGEGVSHLAVLMRHSAREFVPDRHDLENPLTSAGRAVARRLGEGLPKSFTVRGYASPPQRCMETAELVLAGHRIEGGAATRHRPVEGLGVFYALDQMKMWRGLRGAGGLPEYLGQWFRGEVPADAMMPADVAARLVFQVVAEKLKSPVADQQLDLCVTHDMTVMLVRDRLLGQAPHEFDVDFLDALVAFERDGVLWLQSAHGPARVIDPGRSSS